MFHDLIASPRPPALRSYSVHNGTLTSRLSTGTTADGISQYLTHVDIPIEKFPALCSDWHAHVKVLYESGVYGGVDSDAAPVAPTNLIRRFHFRVGLADDTDPKDSANSQGVSAPAETNNSRGGQLSCEIASVRGSMGDEVRVSSSWNAQSDFLQHQNPLSRWHDQYNSGGLRLIVFFSWEPSYAANHIMKVVSLRVDVSAGEETIMVKLNAPRTLTLSKLGLHWNSWPAATELPSASPPLGNLFGTVRSWEYGDSTSNWDALDTFVAKHATKQKIITISPAPQQAHEGGWHNFCTQFGTRYAGKGIHYELFDEPSAASYAAADLSELVVQAANALRAADPSCKIIGPGFANVLKRGPSLGYDYARDVLSANSNAVLNSVDYVGFHAYPMNSASGLPSPLSALASVNNMRLMLTNLGAPTKPLYLTEISSVARRFKDLSTAQRRAFLLRSVITVLLSDAHLEGIVWYGVDNFDLGWTQVDADAWNDAVSFLTSGPVSHAVVEIDGEVTVTVGELTRRF